MSWKRNPYKYLYEWIQGLRDQGYNHDQILKAFETNQATRMNPDDVDQVTLADVIIRHALGEAADSEIEKYCTPTDVEDFEVVGECHEGYAFKARTPDNEDDFYFLVDKNAVSTAESIEDINFILEQQKDRVCNLVLYKSHIQHPYGVSNMPFEVAKAKLTWRDFSS